MTDSRRMTTKARTLSECPFPRALAELWQEKATGTALLTSQNLEKQIIFEAGAPVFAESIVSVRASTHPTIPTNTAEINVRWRSDRCN